MKLLLWIVGVILAVVGAGIAFIWWYDSAGQKADTAFDSRVVHPAFPNEHPRVAIDEAHRNFHTISGRYKPLADLLRNDGFEVVASREPLISAALERTNILVIANALGPKGDEARPAFTPAEEDRLTSWVAGGGSLLLIADHAPFGAAAERLGARFGVKMHLRYARDDNNHEGWDNERLLFARTNGLLPSTVFSRGRNPGEAVNRVVTFTGQSLSGPVTCQRVLPLSDQAYDWESRSVRFPARGHSEALACPFGRGRVFILGEAGMLTAQVDPLGFKFGMNRSGNDDKQFALNVFHWLARAA
jgi:hypothetical protein